MRCKWSEEELNIVRNFYHKLPIDEVIEMLPRRTILAIRCCATRLRIPGHKRSMLDYVTSNINKHSGVFGEDNRYITECWEWTLKSDIYGYGHAHYDGQHYLSHRLSYEMFVGKIPDGLTIDHLCRNKKCVRPDHLEPVTSVENVMRGNSLHAINARKTHCKRGHEFTEENIYSYRGTRICKRCHLLDMRKRTNYQGRVYNGEKTHCIHGHGFISDNTYINKNGSRQCKQCILDRNKRYRREGRYL